MNREEHRERVKAARFEARPRQRRPRDLRTRVELVLKAFAPTHMRRKALTEREERL